MIDGEIDAARLFRLACDGDSPGSRRLRAQWSNPPIASKCRSQIRGGSALELRLGNLSRTMHDLDPEIANQGMSVRPLRTRMAGSCGGTGPAV